MAVQAKNDLPSFEDVLSEMTFDFFGSGQHKMTADGLLSQPDGVLLDIRSIEEVQTLSLPFSHDITVLHIPTNEIPERFGEIPIDRPVAILCSAGIRAAMVYVYLRMRNYGQVRILVGGLEELAKYAKPGRLWTRLRGQGTSS